MAAFASCNGGTGPGAAKLGPVQPLPKPSLPAWISSISPTQTAQSLAQIRVIFAKPVTKIEALSGDGPQEVLSHVKVQPALAGRFVVLTPRMIGFVADQALPVGTRVQVTLTAGLSDLSGDSLANDLSWTFQTDGLAFTDIPQTSPSPSDAPTPPPVGLRPTMKLTANAKVDEASLASHLTLNGGGTTVPVDVKLEVEPTPLPGSNAAALFDPSIDDWVYDVTPTTDLKTDTTYTIAIAPGVEPAYGNVPTAQAFTGGVRTYGTFALVSPQPTPGSAGRFDNGDPSISFTNPVDPATLAGAITVSPAPANVKTLVALSYDASVVNVNPYALDPNTTYTIAVAPTLKDTFGQTLGTAQTVTFKTGNFTAGAWAPSGRSTIAAGTKVDLDFYATNVSGGYTYAYQTVPPLSVLTDAGALSALPSRASWTRAAFPNAKVNQQSVVRVPLQQLLGSQYGSLAYGFATSLDDPNNDPSNVGVAQLTNLGIFAQYFPANASILVQHLSDGKAAPGVNLTVYRIGTNGDKTTADPCATGTTGAAGEFDLSGQALESCYSGSSQDNAPELGVIATEGSDSATLRTSSYSGAYRFNVYGGWSGGAPLSRGTAFTDRSMYQPGERGEITGIAYYASNGKIVADRNATYTVTLSDPNNTTLQMGKAKTDAFGVFEMPLVLSKNQALGYYTIDAKGTNGNDITGSFRVAEFKPPNFSVDLKLDGTSATAGNSVRAAVTANYLFGAPLQGGSLHAVVSRDQADLAPTGWDDYSFGPHWYYPEERPSFTSDVSDDTYTLDAQGKASFSVPAAKDLPFPMTYTVDVTTTDVSNLTVSDTATFLALASDAIIGLDSDVVGPAASPMPIKVIVTDADGKAIAGRPVHLELQKMTYTDASQSVDGGEDAQQSIKYDTVATADTTSGDKPVTANLTPPDPGSYRVRANFGSSQDVATSSDILVYAYGGSAADWGAQDPSQTPVKLDKKSYAVGDTATALIASPFAASDVYFSVVRNNAIYRTVLHDVTGSPKVSFKVTSDMLPNAAVQALVVRRGANLSTVKPGTLNALSTVGMAGFDVSVADRYLALDIAPQNATTAPGGSQSVKFTLKTKGGAPAQGEVVAMVVNDAILQLTGYRLPDLVQTVFAAQPISTVFSDSREGVVLSTQLPPTEKGFGFGGGYLAGAGSTRVRQNFLPLAHYAIVKTDANGIANMSFTMPDDLTTWRVMAVALGSDDAHFVTNDATFISKLPLITNPLLPQFARPGDTIQGGVSVANQTGAAGALDLVLQLTGALTFTNGNAQTQTANEQAATGMQGFRFPIAVGTPAPSTFQVTSKLGTESDAFKVPFSVLESTSTDSVIESGVTTKSANVPMQLDKGGWLQITLANSIVPQFAVPANDVFGKDYVPLADESAARLQIASALRDLEKPYRLDLDFDPAAEQARSLTTLLTYQRGDGGFMPYRGATSSDPFDSAYALQALAFARAHGASVPAGAASSAASYVSGVLANPGQFGWCEKNDLCKAYVRFAMLWALSANGDHRSDFLAGIVAQSSQFDQASQIMLARYLLATPGWQAQGAALADKLQQTLYVTGRYATENQPSRWWGFFGATQVDAQAQMLQLLLQRQSAPELLDGAVRQLMAQQCGCGWPTTYATATALTALSAYAATEHLAPATATVTVGGKTVASAQFGATASSQTVKVAASTLAGGSAAAIASTAGKVHYTLVYTYDVPSDAPGELSAFRVVRTVTEPGPTSSPLATMDLGPAAPVSVGPGRVFDIGVRVIVDHPVDRVVIADALPAGFEAVDTSFKTASSAIVPQSDSWDIDSQVIYRDQVMAYAAHLGPGVYEIHYLVQSVTPGTYRWPGARAYLQDAPEEFGRSAATTLTISQ